MNSKIMSRKQIGVIGAGSFGTAIANILAENQNVILYVRRKEAADEIQSTRISAEQELLENITVTNSLEEVASSCEVIFPIVPATNFREMMKSLSPFLRPYHILIHGTKGLDVIKNSDGSMPDTLTRDHVKTMSEIIQEESVVVRVGCLAGPNLARELVAKLPAATVVASHFDEVIDTGIKLLRSDRFQVYGNKDLIGIELSGVLKNIIAIASGVLSGLEYGENARALLISRGMIEMIHLGTMLGGEVKAFIGLAGVGDLVATCTSKLSRNYTVGFRIAKGETLNKILATMMEVAEGVHTIQIINKLTTHYKVRAPISDVLYKVLFEDMSAEQASQYLMRYPYNIDINFL